MTSVGIFIDGLNVRFRLRECGWCEFYDVGYLVNQLVGPRQLEAAFYFHPQPNQEHLGPDRYAQERAYLTRVQKDGIVAVPEGAYFEQVQNPAVADAGERNGAVFPNPGLDNARTLPIMLSG